MSFHVVIKLKVIPSTNIIRCTCNHSDNIFIQGKQRLFKVDEGLHITGQPLMNVGQ